MIPLRNRAAAGATLVLLAVAGTWAADPSARAAADAYGEPLPPHAVARLSPVRPASYALPAPPDGTTARSASGRLLAETAGDGFVEVRDTTRDKRVLRTRTTSWLQRLLVKDPPTIRGLAISADERLLAVATHTVSAVDFSTHVSSPPAWTSIEIVDLRSGHTRTLDDGARGFSSVAFSPDGTLLAATAGDALRAWRLPALSPAWTAGQEYGIAHGPRVEDVRFSPDGRVLATRGDAVRVWDAASGRLLQTMAQSPDESPIVGLTFSRDGSWLAWAGQGTLRVARPHAAAEAPRVLRLETGRIAALAFVDRDTLAVADDEHGVRLWRVSASAPFRVVGEMGKVRALAASPDGRLLAGAAESRVRMVDIESGVVAILEGHRDDVSVLAFSPDGRRLASGSADTTTLVWDVGAALTVP